MKKGSGDLPEITQREIKVAEIGLTGTVQNHSYINVWSFTKQNAEAVLAWLKSPAEKTTRLPCSSSTSLAISYILQCVLYALFCTTSHKISIICKAIHCHKEIVVKFLPREIFHSSNWQGARM